MAFPSGNPGARALRFGLVAAASAAAIVASACTGGHGNAAATSPALPSSPTALPTVTLDVFRAILDGLHGRPVLLNVWASWCGPCIEEAPALANLAREYAGRVRFVGLDVSDTPAKARAFVRKFGWTFPSLSDPTHAVRSGLGYVGQPVTVLFDAEGTRVFVQAGPISEQEIRAALAKVA